MIKPLSHALPQPIARKSIGLKAPVGANFFGTQLSTVVKGSPMSSAKPTISSSKAAPSTANLPAPSQNTVAAALFSLASGPTAAPAPAPAKVVAPAADTTTVPSGPISTQAAMGVLSDALQAAGINPQSLNMYAHDDYVSYPVGVGYMNHLISLTANGHDTNIDANLMMINPNVAVTEIERLMTMA
jgi:hypothetical protein